VHPLKVELDAAKFREAKARGMEARAHADLMHGRLSLEGVQLVVQTEMEEALRTLELSEEAPSSPLPPLEPSRVDTIAHWEVDRVRAEEAEKEASRKGGDGEVLWASVPEMADRTICIDVQASVKGDFNDEVKNKLIELHTRGRIAKLFSSFHGAPKLAKAEGGGMAVEYVPPPKEPEEDPHTYTIAVVYGAAEFTPEPGSSALAEGWWVELDDETGQDDYPPVWIADEFLSRGQVHPMIQEFADSMAGLNPIEEAKKQAAQTAGCEQCHQGALQGGKAYTDFHSKANAYFCKLALKKCDHPYEFKYESKYLYKHSVEI
jgi:hypothetical protein